MLCSRPSPKDISWPRGGGNNVVDDDPLSPKVGCMGQVKRNNRVVCFPNPGTSRHTSKQPRIKRMFSSSKCLTSASVSKQAVTPELSSCRAARYVQQRTETKRIARDKEKAGAAALVISVIDMDRPLPVTRRSTKDMERREDGNLWKRRSGGIGLKRLELTSSSNAAAAAAPSHSWLPHA